jgi:REP element-mobilizing transposase RayT
MVKAIAVCAKRKDVIVVIYTVVSNHCHIVVLAASHAAASAFGEEVKRMYSMWFSRKYHERGILRRVMMSAIYLDSDWYVRNALAYVPRNALDNGCNVDEYKWSGYRAMFRGHQRPGGRKVAAMTKRERESVLHTGMALKDVAWVVEDDGCLVPGSFCDKDYLEQAFGGSQAFFLKTIGNLNPAEMGSKLVDMPRKRAADGELLKAVEELSLRWFESALADISLERKMRLLAYVFRTRKTTAPQLARVLGLEREMVETAVKRLNG